MTAASPADYANRVLVLQGGGALGSYQAGVFEGLVDAGIGLDWVAGISIGALNAALIAGSAPERRVEQLHAFWDEICQQPWLPPLLLQGGAMAPESWPAPLRRWLAALQSTRAVFEGQRGFFVPRSSALPFVPGAADAATASYYSTAPLKATLERLVDFDRINHRTAMRVSLGAVNVRTGDLVYFDSRQRRLGAEHFMASAALPPAFAAVEVDGEYYWDGGILMNTPLIHVLMSQPRQDALVFQVDLWNSTGPLPTSLPEVEERKKDILFSSRTRMVNDYMREHQNYRKTISDLLALVPAARRNTPAARRAAALACDRRCNVQQLICADARYEGSAKDYEFGATTMQRHWRSGLDDIERTLAQPGWAAMPSEAAPFKVHTFGREDAAAVGATMPAMA